KNIASSSSFQPFPKTEQEEEQITTLQEETRDGKAMTIVIDQPQKQNGYMTYRLVAETSLETYKQDKRPVRRRFRDFLWLHHALTIAVPTCVIPPLPEKHRLKYIKGNRFDPLFIEQRRLGLQWFMDRIARHPVLQDSQFTRLFLESTDFVNSLFNRIVKVKKPDDQFIDMKESIDKFQDNLEMVQNLYARIAKRQLALEQHYLQFGKSIRGLSALELNVDQPLRQFAEATESFADALQERRKQENLLFLNDIHELLNYCHVQKEQLVERDQKQVDFENLSANLQSVILEREKILYPGKRDYVTDKVKPEPKTFISFKLQDQVAKANDTNNTYSTQMAQEFDLFQETTRCELKDGLLAYSDCHIDFYKKSISIWENILPVLDQIQLEEDL
ncbi:Phox-like protein, partial [Backusella circina FSU 941]